MNVDAAKARGLQDTLGENDAPGNDDGEIGLQGLKGPDISFIPEIDGLIIRDRNYQAVFLPVVWEQLPDKHEFLEALKQKAGMPYNYKSDTLEAFTFQTIYIKE